MTSSTQITGDLMNFFRSGVSAVQAENLFQKKNFRISDDKSTIICRFDGNQLINIENKQCHLIGFGKAVYGMANECSKILGNRLKSGILNVPMKTIETFPSIQLPQTIQVFESAKNNLPDTNAERVALRIVNYIEKLNQDDVLFILISGGGSALLPLPSIGVTLAQKLELIKNLANKGATISDLNRVRIDLSRTKGGKLCIYAKNASSVTAFIISDIIGDPIDLIASGPTVQLHLSDADRSPMAILEKYNLWDTLASNVKEAIIANANASTATAAQQMPEVFSNVRNIIIGNNETAINAVLKSVSEKQILGIVLSTQIEGNVVDISKAYFELCTNIQLLRMKQLDEDAFDKRMESLKMILSIRDQFYGQIKQIIHQSKTESKDMCIIGGGEPTVQVRGDGIGGRNQELALRFSRFCYEEPLLNKVWLLSAGTDGIDGEWSIGKMF